MKKGIVSLLVVLLIFSMLTFLANLFQMVNATYVEGIITHNTVWMLIDSPFIVINNVTVLPGVTLTIEPGVEVRFGGNFSLNVEGTLIADGTEERPIIFTSNKHEAEAGDWIGIKFSDVADSYLSYCTIKYAVHGITVENSSLTISNCEITENLKSGIKIVGDSNLTVNNSKIMLNENGIIPIGLNINSSRQVTIQNTVISSNSFSGIFINGSVWNLNVMNCSLMSNEVGIYISGETNANITHNSVAYNEIGVLYDHVSHAFSINYNDIYNNTLAMQSLNSTVPIDATHNYWGDKSGPHHPSLNPDGKGNPIESNGTDIDFIPFLTYSVRYTNQPPVARLLSDKITVAPNQEVLFIGTNSSDDGRVDYYRFEFGDGTDSGWTTLSAITHKYSMNGSYTVKLTVLDDFGAKSNTAEVTINVQNLPTLDVSLTLSTSTIDVLKNVSVIVQVKSGETPIENSFVRLFSIKGGFFVSETGYTNATGYFVTTFTTPNVTEETNIMLVATASKEGYADGSCYKYVRVLPPLTIDLKVEPKILRSEETVNVNVYVTHLEQPIPEAIVEVSSNLTGVFSASGVTDIGGKCIFNFTAPAVRDKTSIAITVIASKEGYANGVAYSTIIVEPKNMTVQVNVYPETIFSDENSTISIYVSYEEWPIAEAQVDVTASIGSLSSQIETTDSYGQAVFVYQAPTVYEETVAILNITVSKDGYSDVTLQSTITIEPKVLTIEVETHPEMANSGETITLTVHVKCNDSDVQNALVTLVSDFGNLSQYTNSRGLCVFSFAAPQVTSQTTFTLVITASKNGYLDASETFYLDVAPTAQTGFPLTTFMIIAVIILIIIVIIALLFKFKVIEVSWEEEAET